MKLIRVQAKNFRSIEDSNTFEVSDLTCLVGKNEAGKTALLHALYGINPFRDYKYEKTRDYPRRHLNSYNERHINGKSEVVKTWWELTAEEEDKIKDSFGEGSLKSNSIEVSYGINFNRTRWVVDSDEPKILKHLFKKHQLNTSEKSIFKNYKTSVEVSNVLSEKENLTNKESKLLDEIKTFRDKKIDLAIIDALSDFMPKVFYTSHFERMSGEVSVNQLSIDEKSGNLSPEDQIFLDFLKYAGTSLEELKNVNKYEELKARCEGASNNITDEIFNFWSQNKMLSVEVDIASGRQEDPAPFNEGTIAKIRIKNNYHRASVPLSERSAGFIWFFSFLSQFKQLKNQTGNAIILLDEPGLTLHGKAQSDLLRYIQERLLPFHQVIYTTHSPFMVPADRLVDVRVVEDVVVEKSERSRLVIKGTKVSSDVLSVDKDTLFPLQGHLGYELTQSLFVGKNTLLVEGPSDILYLQALSQALKNQSREGLNPRWVICPTGGIDKIHSFVSLFGGNNLNVAVLCDLEHGSKRKVERLKKSQILRSNQVYTIADFTNKTESDIEDIFHSDLYSKILNKTYSLSGQNIIDTQKLTESLPKSERIVKQAENVFKLMPEGIPEFDHFTPSDWLIRHPEILEGDSEQIISTLKTAEEVFKAINALLN